ncbi:adenosylcobinamide-GDP ribazoletransferase [Halobacillus sp. A5]|uniref:adenosylcobinamide-GDP ribazoletransferase n=1 Tax=Halobacillus sp. A5 TaxID=2880263 RepID=UPI0020A69C20|nr:adenosylcobinamide-GDP ribazoletransferase [Halobacillus sp. A5]MCP3027868.1 adenosylcobinamide-GDP ribazoletransferase [Halobacillus sp. A5]
MKNLILSVLFTLQFFSIIPVHREIEPTPSRVRASLSWLPVIGLGFGAVNLLFITALQPVMSPVTLVIVALTIPIVLSGGLHLDGLMDTGDAYFSYKERDKRLDVMKDPRTGAFGVLVLLAVLALRFVFMYESFRSEASALWLLVLIPALARVAMVGVLGHVPSAKNTGLSSFFQQSYRTGVTWSLAAMSVFLLFGASLLTSLNVSIALGVAAIAGIFMIKMWSLRAFGGITGDVCGAALEGMVTLLWLIVWIFI